MNNFENFITEINELEEVIFVTNPQTTQIVEIELNSTPVITLTQTIYKTPQQSQTTIYKQTLSSVNFYQYTSVNFYHYTIGQNQLINTKQTEIQKEIYNTNYFDLNNLQYQIYLEKKSQDSQQLDFNINLYIQNNFSLSNFKIDKNKFLPSYFNNYYTYKYYKNLITDSNNSQLKLNYKNNQTSYTYNYNINEDKYNYYMDSKIIDNELQNVAIKLDPNINYIYNESVNIYPYININNTLNNIKSNKNGYKSIYQSIEDAILFYSSYSIKKITKLNNIDINKAIKNKTNILGLLPLLRFPIINFNKSLVDNNILIKKYLIKYKVAGTELYRYFGNINIPFKKIINKLKNRYSIYYPQADNKYMYFNKNAKETKLTYKNQYNISEEIYLNKYNKKDTNNQNLPLGIEYTNFNDSKFYNLDTTIELCDNLYRTQREISLLNEKDYLIILFTEYLYKSNIKNYQWDKDEILFLFNKYTYKRVEIPMIINHVTNNKFYILKYTLELI